MKCCCGHDASLHFGGPDTDLKEYSGVGDGGMCRASRPDAAGRGAVRCDCFNFCDCLTLAAE
jgi:hypothetical protein